MLGFAFVGWCLRGFCLLSFHLFLYFLLKISLPFVHIPKMSKVRENYSLYLINRRVWPLSFWKMRKSQFCRAWDWTKWNPCWGTYAFLFLIVSFLYSVYKRTEDDRIKRLVMSVPFCSTILLLFLLNQATDQMSSFPFLWRVFLHAHNWFSHFNQRLFKSFNRKFRYVSRT